MKGCLCLSLCLVFSLKVSAQINFCQNGEPSAADCELLLCTMCDINGYMGTTAGFGPDPDNDLFFLGFCSTIQNVQYIRFYAAQPSMSITVTATGCSMNSGIDLAIMPICDVQISGCITGNGSNATTIALNGLIPTHDYVLIIDVDAVGDCGLEISVDPPDATNAVNIPLDVNNISGDFMVCPNALVEYSISPYHVGNDYEWTLPPGAVITNSTNHGSEVKIYWGDSDGGEICVTQINPCSNNSKTICRNVTVAPIPETILPPAYVCDSDTPYTLPWGESVEISGVYSNTITSFQGCDSTLVQNVTILHPIFNYEGPTIMCEEGCLTRCGQEFCGYGAYSVTCSSHLGCDSTIVFSIVPSSNIADIQGDGAITCAQPQIVLSSTPSNGIKAWYNDAGQQVGAGASLTVSTPGAYLLYNTLPVGGQNCIRIDSVYIPLDTIPPALAAMGVRVGCDTFPALVHATSTDSIALYTWTGPNGFMATGPNPEVAQIGFYVVQAVDFFNGCVSFDTVEVRNCCTTDAGAFDSALVHVCGPKWLNVGFHHDAVLTTGDSLTFFLYSNPANPLGSILMYSDTAAFPFINGIQQFDSLYYAAVLVGTIGVDHSIRTDTACWSISNGQPLLWSRKPGFSLAQAPGAVCKGDCMDIAFDFSGAPPFQFHLGISQNGIPLYSNDLISNDLHKIFTICPSDFTQPMGSGPLSFSVGQLRDFYCDCGD